MFHSAEVSVASPSSDTDVKALFDSLQVKQEDSRAVLLATLPTEVLHKLAPSSGELPSLAAPPPEQKPVDKKAGDTGQGSKVSHP